MGGDYTRNRYSARTGYIGVLEQQGRVRLDADGNEHVESIDRRHRAEAIDTIGHGVVPSTTPAGFEIQLTAGQLTIGPGRAYVDGILVDCWGDDPQAFQADLGEPRGKSPLAYNKQPFYYGSTFPALSPNSAAIVYLDVWEREVTALEEPLLIDPTIEGIDTTTRIQAAWQVKALNPKSVTSCTDNPPEWVTLIAPPTGVLSTATTPAPASGSPCIIDPVGGYTGLENRLYRVQIQKSGTVGGPGAAQFVWSKDNASLGATLLSISSLPGNACQLSVTTLGRDKTFGFNVNDHLEVLDDFVEWSMRETNSGGTFVTVSIVDPEQLTINVTPDISSFAVVAGRHPRVRRWDAAPQPTQTGVAIPLGVDGVTATFGPTDADTLRAGDYWVFYARTATGTIEVLNQAPPRGVLHHYMRLALISHNQPPQDCRIFWPPPVSSGSGCCCTVMVKPEDVTSGGGLQKILSPYQNAKEPVTICLSAGEYLLSAPLVLGPEYSGITLEGCRGASLGVVKGGESKFLDGMVVINQAANVTLRGLTFTLPLVPFGRGGASFATIPAATLEAAGGPSASLQQRLLVSIGVRPMNCSSLTVRDCAFLFPALNPRSKRTSDLFAVGLLAGGECAGLTIEGNTFLLAGLHSQVQISVEPFQLLIGIGVVPIMAISELISNQGVEFLNSLTANGTVIPSSLQDALFRDNVFSGLTAAALTYGETDAIRVEGNTVEQSYSGFWFLGRRTPPDLGAFTSSGLNAVPSDVTEALIDPVLQLGSAIARSYPPPAAYTGPNVPLTNVNLSIGTSPFPSGSLLDEFDVLLQFVAGMELQAASDPKNPAVGFTFSLHFLHNRIDAEIMDPNLGSSGGGLLIWGDEAGPFSDVTLCANRIINNSTAQDSATEYMTTVTVVMVWLCTITGNLFLNEASNSSPVGCLYVFAQKFNPTDPPGIAVTGNVFWGSTNIPTNLLPNAQFNS